MIWSNWNKADKTLLFAFVVFLFALCVHLEFPDRLVADAFLFCAEAALVGGIADWFAVTALFRKPLGFPYHTAILPRRRDAFIHASVQMIQTEFFSRRKIFHHLEKWHIMPMLLEWLAKPETEEQLTHRLQHYVRDIVMKQDIDGQSKELAHRIPQSIARVEPEDFFAALGGWLRRSGRDKEMVQYLCTYLRPLVLTDEARAGIRTLFENYGKERAQGGWAQFFEGIAEATGVIDYDEAAGLLQKQIVDMLDKLGTADSDMQREMLALFYEKAVVLNRDPEFHQLVHELKDSLLDDLPFEKVIHDTLTHVRKHFAEDKARSVDPVEEHLPKLHSQLLAILRAEYERTIQLIQTDEQLRRAVGHFLYDLIARSALHAQTLIGVIIQNVLSRLTDDQLNHLVYDKVEPDLLWIRMNGSIVGSIIGLVLFAILQVTALY